MELKKMLVGLEGLKVRGDLSKDIKGIEKNSKEVKEGYLFVAIKGFSVDGHKFIENAIENGATAIMIEEGCNLKGVKLPEDVAIIMAKNTREALAISAANFYGNPSAKLKLIGVTGTKGKTTTTYMIKEILEKAGKKVGLIGTIATYINGKKKSLQKYAREYLLMGNECITQAHDVRAALANYDKAIELYPEYIDARIRKGITLFNEKEFFDAKNCTGC